MNNTVNDQPIPVTNGLPLNPTANDMVSYVIGYLFRDNNQASLSCSQLSVHLSDRRIDLRKQERGLILTYNCRYVRAELCLAGQAVIHVSGSHGLRLQYISYRVWVRSADEGRFLLQEVGRINLSRVRIIKYD